MVRFQEPFHPSHPMQRKHPGRLVGAADMQIGTAQLTFTVDPDQNVTADANRSNNDASISVFIGRAPNASLVVDEGKYTFENITLNATQSFDIDGGDVDCRFEIESQQASSMSSST